MSEKSEVSLVSKDDPQGFADRVNQILNEIGSNKPEDIMCILTCIVTHDGKVAIAVLGDDENIAKMLTSVVTIARNGVLQAHSPENNNGQMAH